MVYWRNTTQSSFFLPSQRVLLCLGVNLCDGPRKFRLSVPIFCMGGVPGKFAPKCAQSGCINPCPWSCHHSVVLAAETAFYRLFRNKPPSLIALSSTRSSDGQRVAFFCRTLHALLQMLARELEKIAIPMYLLQLLSCCNPISNGDFFCKFSFT